MGGFVLKSGESNSDDAYRIFALSFSLSLLHNQKQPKSTEIKQINRNHTPHIALALGIRYIDSGESNGLNTTKVVI